ncbi:MAG: c-type cytochrome [Gaiellaceae bacterium]
MGRALIFAGVLAGLVLFVLGCGSAKTVTPTPETVIGTVPQEATPTVNPSEGDPAAGKEIFSASAQPPCSSCHTYGPAGSNATVGPNLDTALEGKDANFVLESIVRPNDEIAPGFQGIMPANYGETLDDKQLADLVAFLTQPSS